MTTNDSNDGIRIFNNATAILTGGASGIGEALARELAARGCDVTITDLQIERAEELAAQVRSSGGLITAVKADVTDYSAMEKIIQDTAQRTGRLDYLFNNAGVVLGGEVCHYGIDDWNFIIDVNLKGVVNGIQAAYPIMIEQGFGHIVNTASMAGLVAGPGNTAYTTTKHAVVGLSNSMRCEASAKGVRVSALCPGFIRTPILDDAGKFGRVLFELTPEQKRIQNELIEKAKPMDPELFAKKALDQVARNRPIVILPSFWKFIWMTQRMFPLQGLKSVQKSYRKMLRKMGIVSGASSSKAL
ncbi:MAG: SDR family oxidoreductase [bacterium]|nr:SDR family oxidoreductase [bacterium]